MRFLLALLIAALSVVPSFAQAPPSETPPSVACMVEKTTPEDEEIFKAMFIAALKDDTGQMKSSLVQMASLILNVAMVRCDVPLSVISSPEFQRISQLYGAKVGEKIMANAMAKLR
jgi:hypothetical protein